MDLNEATYRGISHRSPRSEGGPVRRLVGEIAAVFGTTPPAGISERTWRSARNDPKWKPSEATEAILEAYQRRVRLPVGRERWMRDPYEVGVHALTLVSTDERERKIPVRRWAGSGQFANATIDRFLNRDDPLGQPIMDVIDAAVPDMQLLDVYEVKFFQTEGEFNRWARG